jgi:hypothetical protein
MDGRYKLHRTLPGRDKDLLGVALSYTKISNDYVINNIPVHSGHETILESHLPILRKR